MVKNDASRRVLERIGMQREGYLRQRLLRAAFSKTSSFGRSCVAHQAASPERVRVCMESLFVVTCRSLDDDLSETGRHPVRGRKSARPIEPEDRRSVPTITNRRGSEIVETRTTFTVRVSANAGRRNRYAQPSLHVQRWVIRFNSVKRDTARLPMRAGRNAFGAGEYSTCSAVCVSSATSKHRSSAAGSRGRAPRPAPSEECHRVTDAERASRKEPGHSVRRYTRSEPDSNARGRSSGRSVTR